MKSDQAQAKAIIYVRNSQCDLANVKSKLERLDGIYEVQIIALTSNVFVRYDPKIVTLEDIRSFIGK